MPQAPASRIAQLSYSPYMPGSSRVPARVGDSAPLLQVPPVAQTCRRQPCFSSWLAALRGLRRPFLAWQALSRPRHTAIVAVGPTPSPFDRLRAAMIRGLLALAAVVGVVAVTPGADLPKVDIDMAEISVSGICEPAALPSRWVLGACGCCSDAAGRCGTGTRVGRARSRCLVGRSRFDLLPWPRLAHRSLRRLHGRPDAHFLQPDDQRSRCPR